MQIVFCTDGIFPHKVGGMQRHSFLLITELAKNPALHIIVIHPHPVSVFGNSENIKEESIAEIDFTKNYLKECYEYSKRVAGIIDRYPNAIIYAQGLTVWYNINKYQSRLIINPHGLEPYQAIGVKDKLIALPFKRVFNKIFKSARVTISLGGKLTQILEKKAKKVIVIPNATNLPELSSEKDYTNEKLNILFVGRFASNKGINLLMQAIKILNESGFDQKLIFHLSGKGPLFELYSKKYNYDNIIFHGFTSDEELESLYGTAHLFVLPTLFEGMPTVVLEAMAHKTPIIVSDVGATAELVDAGNGYLINKNDVNALVNALQAFYNLPLEQKTKMAEKSFKKCSANFTWKIVAQKHLQLFQKNEPNF